ncbi:von Willebrand factor type A domain protein [Cooperia oncophora]
MLRLILHEAVRASRKISEHLTTSSSGQKLTTPLAISSDKVAVPVALGHYEDNIDLIQQISDTQKTNDGVAIALYGLNAARQQFQLHGRENATRIVIMITNGRNRGNAAPAAEDLRNIYNVQLFILAVAADAEGLATLKRIAGNVFMRISERS